MKSIRVVIFLGWLSMGGAERQALYLAKFLKAQRFDIHILGMGSKGAVSEECERCGIPWTTAPSIHQTGIRNLHRLFQFRGILKRLQPTILLPYTATPNMIAGIWWKSVGANVTIWNQRDSGLVRPHAILERLSAQHTPCFIANSESGFNFLHSIGVTKPITIIPNGVPPHPSISKLEARTKFNVDKDAVVYGMLANLHTGKDHKTLLNAWAQAKVKNGILLIAGRNDGQLQALLAQAQSLQIQDSVRFLGGIVNTPAWLSALDVLIHSSLAEGCPNAVLEAMAAKLPVIGTNIPAITNLLDSKEYAFKPGSAQELAKLITRFASNIPLCKIIGEANLSRAKDYSIDCMCNKTLAMISPFISKSNV